MKRQDGTDRIVEAINRQNAILELMGETIGKSVARWLIKTNLPAKQRELQCVVYLELGFQPTEIVDLLYPNLGKTDRRAKAKSISKWSSK